MTESSPTLIVLRRPETLLSDADTRLSHGGILTTPSGLLTILVLEHPGPPPPDGDTPPWTVYLARPGHRHATLALPDSFSVAGSGVQFTVFNFGPVPDPGDLWMVIHHPQLPHSVSLGLGSAPAQSATTRWLAEPDVLASPGSQPAQVWHTGLLRIGDLLFTHLEASADDPGLVPAFIDVMIP
ncbi:hypothetical protein ACIG5E_36015 [Kitasatospora sp. NPDC053057]|uniref:hypothetical protein n=1 Tax=Kitasatospora sp. NPDC053057 TaxID=3364062 RepID=UPI0037C856EB